MELGQLEHPKKVPRKSETFHVQQYEPVGLVQQESIILVCAMPKKKLQKMQMR